jgi:hypothetical protein
MSLIWALNAAVAGGPMPIAEAGLAASRWGLSGVARLSLAGAGRREDGLVSDDLTGLGPRGFERMCQAVATYVLGPGIEVFGSGPDGGREASFRGRVPYPSSADPWDGFGIVQAKFKERILGTGTDTAWLRRHVKAELDAWADPGKARVSQGRRPDYLIVATNIPLSGLPGSGGKARIDKLIGDYASRIGLKDWRVWDAGQITAFLNAYPDVRRAFAALITPSEILAQLRDRFDAPPEVSVVLNIPAAAIRPGQPGCEAPFTAAYNAAGGKSRLGQAIGEVYETGKGRVQHFAGTPSSEPAVICALYGRPAVAVAESVWDEVCAIGGGHPGGGTEGAGFPVGSQPQASFIGSASEEVELAGGQWGPGRLVRQGPGRRIWKPDIVFDDVTTSDRDSWGTGKGDMDLRVRLAARIPVAGSDLRITGAGRERILAALRSAPFRDVLLQAARRRGLQADALEWGETPDGPNNTRFAAYQAVIQASGQQPAFLGNLWFMLPGSYSGELSSVADMRVDFDAIKSLISPGTVPVECDIPLAREELIAFFTQAWIVTTTILPLAATASPLEIPPAGAPRLELHIQNERPENSGKPRILRTFDLVDLSYYGKPRKTPYTDLSVGVTTPLGLPLEQITTLVHDALARMTEDFGFTGAPSA